MWNHRSAFGLLGFILVWLTFFWFVGIASAHLAPGQPNPAPAVAIGHGLRASVLFLWDALQAAF
jgi:hypothetical protein